MHRLQHPAVAIAGHRDDALEPEQVRAFLLRDRLEPRRELRAHRTARE